MKIAFRIFVSLLIAGLIFGAGAFAYKAGMAQGISQAPAVATAISKAAESGQAAPVPPMMYGYGYGFRPYGHHFGFSPFGGICFGIFFLFLFFGFMKMMFFRRMMWHGRHHGRHGPWGKGWEGGVPPMFTEWHKRAHGEVPAADGDRPAEEKKSE